jgi:hypothetical protein
MPRKEGERFKCESCGAEIVYAKACPCPANEPEQHAEICCGQEMKAVGATAQRAKEPVAT